MKIARVITTWDCNRDCDLCCNKTLSVTPKPIRLEELWDYDQVLITGGEPMLYPLKVIEMIEFMRQMSCSEGIPEPVIYLYTALYKPEMDEIIKMVDGVHFTLHYPVSPVDLLHFYRFQELIAGYQEKSFRLYLENRIEHPITVIPNLWARVQAFEPIPVCPLPEDEELFVLQ